MGFCLAKCALGSLKGKVEFGCVQADQLLTDVYFLSNFNQNITDDSGDFAADTSLIGRDQCPG